MRDPYTPPRAIEAGAKTGPVQDEIEALTPRWGVRAAWGTVAASGLLCAFAGLQLLVAVTFVDPLLYAVPIAHVAAGAFAVLAGLKIHEMRRWAAVAGAAVSACIAIAGGVWLVFAVAHGLVSLIGSLVPFGGAGGAVAAGLAIGPCTRADAARTRLFDDGEKALY
jgi:hypothetical protein